MARLGLAVVLFCLQPSIYSQQSSLSGSLSGTIHLADSKAPASGVNVMLQVPFLPEQQRKEGYIFIEPGHFHATTDASGSFVITNVPVGEYYVVPNLSGYVSAQDYIFPGALSPEVQDGARTPGFVRKIVISPKTTSHVDFQLDRGGAIEGTGICSDGRPNHTEASPGFCPTGVALNLSVKGQDGQFRRALGASHPDKGGHFRFEAVPSGTYIVFAALPGGMVRTSRGTQGSSGPIFFFGNTVRPSKARVVEVSGTATQTGVNITVSLTGLHTVRGQVQMPDGKLVNTGVVVLFPTGEKDPARANPLGIDGTFEFDQVVSGTYTVVVEHPPEFEFVGPAPDGKGIRMKRRKMLYVSSTQDVLVTDQDPPMITLRPTPVP